MAIKASLNIVQTVVPLCHCYSACATDVSLLTHLPTARAVADARNNTFLSGGNQCCHATPVSRPFFSCLCSQFTSAKLLLTVRQQFRFFFTET